MSVGLANWQENETRNHSKPHHHYPPRSTSFYALVAEAGLGGTRGSKDSGWRDSGCQNKVRKKWWQADDKTRGLFMITSTHWIGFNRHVIQLPAACSVYGICS